MAFFLSPQWPFVTSRYDKRKCAEATCVFCFICMSNSEKYDVVVIGAGSGGLSAAVGLAKAGKKVLLVEREHLGGECTNSGCIPSKALIHHARSYHQAVSIAGENVKTKKYREVAFEYVRSKITEVLAEESIEHFETLGIKVVMGEATFVSPCAISVSGTPYEYRKAIIATGSSPRPLEAPGLDQKDVLTNQNLFTLDRLPERLLVIGSGPIGLEMGEAFARLGVKVTIATLDNRLAKNEDPAISSLIANKFAELEIEVLLNAHLDKVENRQAIFQIKTDEETVGAERVAYDKVLVAIGRLPNLPDGLKAAGISYSEHGIETNDQYRTSNKYVYAVGDVTEKLKFTHTASDGASQVIKRILSRSWLRVNRQKPVPKVTYLNPEVASVGLSYQEAVAKYGRESVVRIKVSYEDNDRALTEEKTSGLMIVTARRLYGTVLGANIAGERAGETIALFTLAISHKLSLWSLSKVIIAYPTYSLLLQRVCNNFLLETVKNWRRDLWTLTKKHAPKLIALIFWLTLIYSFQHYRISNGLSYSDLLLSLYQFFTMSMWGPIVYIALYTFRPLILFPATLLTALSGALFGFWWGVIYTIVGENLSANLAYSIGRFFGKGLNLEDSILGNWITWLRERPFGSVLFMRLFYVPFDLANYGSGVLRVAWPSYALATLIGIMPGLTTFVALGAAIDVKELKMDGLSFNAFDPKYLALSVTIFLVSIGLMRLLRRWQRVNGSGHK